MTRPIGFVSEPNNVLIAELIRYSKSVDEYTYMLDDRIIYSKLEASLEKARILLNDLREIQKVLHPAAIIEECEHSIASKETRDIQEQLNVAIDLLLPKNNNFLTDKEGNEIDFYTAVDKIKYCFSVEIKQNNEGYVAVSFRFSQGYATLYKYPYSSNIYFYEINQELKKDLLCFLNVEDKLGLLQAKGNTKVYHLQLNDTQEVLTYNFSGDINSCNDKFHNGSVICLTKL